MLQITFDPHTLTDAQRDMLGNILAMTRLFPDAARTVGKSPELAAPYSTASLGAPDTPPANPAIAVAHAPGGEVRTYDSSVFTAPPEAPPPPTTATQITQAMTSAGGGEVDSKGETWDPARHAASKAKNKDGSWRTRRNLDKDGPASSTAAAAPPPPPPPVPTPAATTTVAAAPPPPPPPVTAAAETAPAGTEGTPFVKLSQAMQKVQQKLNLTAQEVMAKYIPLVGAQTINELLPPAADPLRAQLLAILEAEVK